MACTYMEDQQRLQFRKYIIIEGADFFVGEIFCVCFQPIQYKNYYCRP